MWQELSIVHSKPDSQTGVDLLWRTCLRQIHFLPPGSIYGTPVSKGEFYRGIEVHRFLVEICSGLHSPLLGETEVYGQFRDFRASQKWPQHWNSLLDAVEEDVKKIRRTHLVNLGAQSYGSLARKRIQKELPVIIVGGGRLAEEILPWIDANQKFQGVRNPAKVKQREGVTLFNLEELSFLPKSAQWIIAAPISNSILKDYWRKLDPSLVIDFRGEEKFDDLSMPYFDLTQLFGELETVRSSLEVKREQAKLAVLDLSKKREAEVLHRPYGWEDVFA
jgi:glutamyl-tRNA reductase